MQPSEMGRFAFCLSIIIITGLIFEFGIFQAGSRVLAHARDSEDERHALGALVLICLAVGAAFSLFIAAAAAPIDLVFKKDVRWLLVATSALVFFQPFQYLVEQSCLGLNRIKQLSIFQLLVSGSFVLMLISIAALGSLTAGTALGAYLAATGLATAWTVARLRPRFGGVSRYVKLTLKEVRGYGFNMYLARLTGVVSTQADQLAIAYFRDFAPLGLYVIAQKLSNPITTMARSLAVTRFRAFTKLDRVPERITRWNVSLLVASSAMLAAAGPFALRWLFPKYAEAAPLLVPFAIYNLFAGLFQPYNIFLASQGRGAEVRNIAAAIAITSVAGLILLVPRFGAMGAAWTGAGAMALDYALHLYYYRKFRRAIKKS